MQRSGAIWPRRSPTIAVASSDCRPPPNPRGASLTEHSADPDPTEPKSVTWFRTTLYSIGDGVITTDDAGRVRELNRSAEALTGWTEAEARGRPATEVFRVAGEDTAQPISHPVTRVLAEGRAVPLAGRSVLVARDGSKRPIADSAAPITDDHGRIVGIVVVFRDQSAERAADRALADSESRYRLMFESNPHPMWVYDTETLRFLDVNPAAIRQYGYSRDEFLAMTIADIRPEEDIPLLGADLASVGTGLGPTAIWRHLRKDGSQIDVEVTSHSLGKTSARLVLAYDVTARRRTEAALEEQRARLETAQRIAGLGFWEIDLTGSPRRHFWSEEMYRIFGLDPGAASGRLRDFMDVVHPEDRAQVEAAFTEAVAGGRRYDLIHRIVTPAGQIKYVHSQGAIRADPSGQASRAQGTLQDLTEVWQARERLAHQARLVDAVSDAVISTDLEGRILSWNRAAEEIYGKPAEAMLGRVMTDVFQIEYLDESRADARERVLRTGTWRGEIRLLRGDGRIRTILVSTSLLRDASGRPSGFVGVNRDVTELRQLEAAVQQGQRMESVGRLAGGVAHDLNNALQVILNHAELILERIPGVDPIAGDLRRIEETARRSAGLARQLLAFAQQQTAQPRVVDLNAVVEEMRRILERLVGEAIELVWRPGRDLPRIRIDPVQVDQILASLVANSRDAIPDRGRIEIETATVVVDAARAARHPGLSPGPHLALSIRDDGTGMDEATRGRLFEPFFTTKPVGQGTGLGLAAVYGIVKQYGGAIEVETALGAGTTVRLLLPAVAKSPGPEAARTEPEPPRSGSRTVLLVEDEAAILALVRRVLEGNGYRVHAFGEPAQAIEFVEKSGEPIDLVVTDVVMPGLSGAELRDRLESLRPGIRCLFVSGYPAEVIASHGLVAESVDFLQKPFMIPELLEKLREVLGNQE